MPILNTATLPCSHALHVEYHTTLELYMHRCATEKEYGYYLDAPLILHHGEPILEKGPTFGFRPWAPCITIKHNTFMTRWTYHNTW